MINVVVDLSHHNGVVDFVAVKAAGIVGVIHKATQGAGSTKFADPMYVPNRASAGTAGLLWGAYHFGDAAPPGDQADYFLETATPTAGELIVLDWEANGPGSTMSIQGAEAFVEEINAAAGRWPGLYTDLSHYRWIRAESPLKNCWLWLARYSNAPGIDGWTLWQSTDGIFGPEPHTVPGISGPCDRDQFNGDLERLQAFWSNG